LQTVSDCGIVLPKEDTVSKEKEKIRIRAMNAADWPALYAIWSERRVCWGTLQVSFQSEDDVRKKVENPPEGIVRLVAEVDSHVMARVRD